MGEENSVCCFCCCCCCWMLVGDESEEAERVDGCTMGSLAEEKDGEDTVGDEDDDSDRADSDATLPSMTCEYRRDGSGCSSMGSDDVGRDSARERMDDAEADGGPMGDGELLDGCGRDWDDGERELDEGNVLMYIGVGAARLQRRAALRRLNGTDVAGRHSRRPRLLLRLLTLIE